MVKPKIIIHLDGGRVEAIYTSDPTLADADVVVLAEPGDSDADDEVEVKDGPLKGLIVYQTGSIKTLINTKGVSEAAKEYGDIQ